MKCVYFSIVGINVTYSFTDEKKPDCFLSFGYMMTSSLENIFRVIGLCAGNSTVTGEFPPQRPVTRSFDVFFYLRLNKRLNKQSRHRCLETPSRSLWHHCNVTVAECHVLSMSPRISTMREILQKVGFAPSTLYQHLMFPVNENTHTHTHAHTHASTHTCTLTHTHAHTHILKNSHCSWSCNNDNL